jgi:hypothetical protein
MSKTRLSRARPISALLALVTVAAGCGGGGGGSDAPGSVDVTPANQDQLARAAAIAAYGAFAGGALPVAGASGADRAPAPAASTRVAAVPAGAWTLSLAMLRRERRTALLGPIQEPCAVSGSAAATLDDRDDNGVASVDDVLSVTFNACSDSVGEMMNGTLAMLLRSVSTTPRLSFEAAATMTALSFTLPGHTARYDGDLALSYAETSATTETTRTVVEDRLEVRATATNYSDTFTLRAGHTIVSVYDAAALPPGGSVPGLTTTTADGSVASASAGGYVAVTTLAPLLQYDVDAFPRSGHLDVVGKNGSLQLTVLDAGRVRIDLDANGDGAFDQSKTVDWDWIF